MDASPTRAVDAGGGDRGIAGRPGSKSGLASARLLSLVGGDLPGHRRVESGDGRARFAPGDGGPVLEVTSRIDKRFLGRTEIAVFEASYESSPQGAFSVELRHTGGIRRTGVKAVPTDDSELSTAVATALSADDTVVEAALPLDFTHFGVRGASGGGRARVELIGASHVAMALPPMRSYVRLYPDQREALVKALSEVGRVLSSLERRADSAE